MAMKKTIYSLVLVIVTAIIKAAAPPPGPSNNSCNNAINLTTGSTLCGQNSSGVTIETNECYINFAGSTEGSMWYSFNATSTSMVLSFMQTNLTNCDPYYIVYGPYTSVIAGCSTILSPSIYIPCSAKGGTVLSTATPSIYISSSWGMYFNLLDGDPGNNVLLSGLNTTPGNNTYLVQMVNGDCGGPFSSYMQFCIGTNLPASNATPSGASAINSCGTQYNGTSQGGYYPSNNSSPSLGNIDNNTATQCPAGFGGICGVYGNDVPFVINNPSYFTFCATSNGTYNINFDVVSCQQTVSGAQGAQMAILIGTPTSMTLNQVATNPTLPSSPIWSSTNFSLLAGQCAYLLVDGFAGDLCAYSYTLNNIAGGCNLLPIELISFTAEGSIYTNIIRWTTASELNNDYFILEKSKDGFNFEFLDKIDGNGTAQLINDYKVIDSLPYEFTYYKLKQVDFDNTIKDLGIISIINNTIKYKFYIKDENLILNLYSNKNENINLRLMDISGKMIYDLHENLEIGLNKININISDLHSGVYILNLNGRNLNENFKVLK